MICNFYLSVAARIIVLADLFLRYTSKLPGTLANEITIKLFLSFPSSSPFTRRFYENSFPVLEIANTTCKVVKHQILLKVRKRDKHQLTQGHAQSDKP